MVLENKRGEENYEPVSEGDESAPFHITPGEEQKNEKAFLENKNKQQSTPDDDPKTDSLNPAMSVKDISKEPKDRVSVSQLD